MSLTYNKYLSSIISKNPNIYDSDSDSDDWNQYFDIETQTIITIAPKNKKKDEDNTKSYIQFRDIPGTKFFRVSDLILETIKEDQEELIEDIETGKIFNINDPNKKNKDCLTNFKNIVISSAFYISHIAIIAFIIRV